jgi:hypothetical protein
MVITRPFLITVSAITAFFLGDSRSNHHPATKRYNIEQAPISPS